MTLVLLLKVILLLCGYGFVVLKERYMKIMKTRKPKVLLFDIEASNLAANFGILFCVGYKWLGEKKVHMITIRDAKTFKKDPTNDKHVVEEFKKVFEEADLLVGHYSVRYDLPFLQTKCMEHKLAPFPTIAHFDTWRTARDRLKFNSNRLDTISKALPYKKGSKPPRKTPIETKDWVKAGAGNIPALKQVEHHCKMDILVLEDVYNAVKPFSTNHPNLGKLIDPVKEGCSTCGSFNVHKRGTLLTKRHLRQRYLCSDCGSWYSLPIKRSKV